jgi:hypothetical protein
MTFLRSWNLMLVQYSDNLGHTPSSTRNASGDRAPEIHETRRRKKGYTGVDAKEGPPPLDGYERSELPRGA